MKGKKKLVIWVLLFALVASIIVPADQMFAKSGNPRKKKGVKIELTGGDGKIYEPGETVPLWALENATYRLVDVGDNRGWLSVVFTNKGRNFSIVNQTNMDWGWLYSDLSVNPDNEKLMKKIKKDKFFRKYKSDDPYKLLNLRNLGEAIPVFTPTSDLSFNDYKKYLIDNKQGYLTIGTQPTKKANKKWRKKSHNEENYIYECFYIIDLSATGK